MLKKKKAKITRIFVSVAGEDENGVMVTYSDNVKRDEVEKFLVSCEVRLGMRHG